MSLRNKFGILVLAAAFAVVGCSDTIDDLVDPGGEGTLNQAEKAALINAINSSGALDGSPAAAYSTLVVGLLNEVGTISASRSRDVAQAIENGIQLAVSRVAASSYEGAVGVQVGWDFGSTEMGWFMGIIGWNGLSVTDQTVDELVAVYGYELGSSTIPATATMTIGEDLFVQGIYWDGDTYYGYSGDAEVTGSSFTGSEDCTTQTITCSYSNGTMNGNFGFEASDRGEPASNYTQPRVSFSAVPAIKLTLSGSF